MSESREFELVTAIVRELKKVEVDDASKYITIYSNSKVEKILMRAPLMLFELDYWFSSESYYKYFKI